MINQLDDKTIEKLKALKLSKVTNNELIIKSNEHKVNTADYKQ